MRVFLFFVIVAISNIALGKDESTRSPPNPIQSKNAEATDNQCSPSASVHCQPAQSNENRTGNGAAQTPQSHSTADTANERRIADGTERLVIATWGLFAATLFVWGATYGLFRDAKETSRAQLRAYVNVTHFDIANVADPIFDPPKNFDREKYPASIQDAKAGPVAFAWIKNSGQTPALDVIHVGEMTFDTFPTPQGKLKAVESGTRIASVIGPDVPTSKNFKMAHPLTAAQIALLRSGDAAIYVFGTVFYKDVFAEPHYTKYRVMYHIMGGGGFIGSHTTLSVCDAGNDTDRDYQKTIKYRFKEWLKKKLS